ncbi:MAG: tyrosine-type recombinase/integrase [Rhodanobacteraceae bacterium]
MSALAPVLQAFFAERLVRERAASPLTVAAYRDTWRLLLGFAARRTGKAPCALDLGDLDASLVSAFLDYLERERSNTARTRNARLAAVRALFRYAALHHPEHAASIARVLAIQPKRFERAIVNFLTEAEVTALLAAPDPTRWVGRRDRVLLLLAVQTGLRISELIGVCVGDVHLGTGAHVVCHGKGRKERITPLTPATVRTLRDWLAETHAALTDRLFPTRSGTPLSRDAIEHRLALYTHLAAKECPTLGTKTVTAHVLRHTAAMRLLEAGVDTSVIALWLGHEHVDTTAVYLHAHLALKERALAKVHAPTASIGRYRPRDALLAFLEAL